MRRYRRKCMNLDDVAYVSCALFPAFDHAARASGDVGRELDARWSLTNGNRVVTIP